MHKRIWILMLLLATLAFTSAAAAQSIITVSPNGPFYNMTFTGSSPSGAQVTLSSFTGSGTLYPDSGVPPSMAGNYTFALSGTLLVTPNGTPGVYHVDMNSATFSFTFVGDGQISGTISLYQMSTTNSANNHAASFVGYFSANPAASFGNLYAQWTPGDTTATPFTLTVNTPTSVDDIMGTSNSTSGRLTTASLQAPPGSPSSGPEPASIARSGSGLVALGGFIRRRFGK